MGLPSMHVPVTLWCRPIRCRMCLHLGPHVWPGTHSSCTCPQPHLTHQPCPLLLTTPWSATWQVFDADAPWIAIAVQFTYTSLFGAYSSYLFLRTGLIVSTAHTHTHTPPSRPTSQPAACPSLAHPPLFSLVALLTVRPSPRPRLL